MREDDRMFPVAQCALGRCLWQAGKINELSKMINDSGLTRRLDKQQLEQLSRIARGAR